jgi:flagellar biosynthesis/type III secretory pathway protein FliH
MFHDILEDSWSYQEIVQKGLDQGLQKGLDLGREQEKLLSARSFLTRIVEKQFPPLLSLAQKKVALLKTVDDLNSAIDKLLDAQTIEQARQVLEEVKKQPHS